MGEVVRRIDGRSLGTYWQEEFAAPLGLDAHIGTGPEFDDRISTAIEPPPETDFPDMEQAFGGADSVGFAAFTNPPLLNPGGESFTAMRGWKAAEMPAVNGHVTARSLARIYGAAASGGEVDGIHVLNPETIEQGITEQTNGPDTCIGINTRFGLGWALTADSTPWGPNPRVFGHPGAGGSLGYADLDAGIGFGYVMNRMGTEVAHDVRAAALIDALYGSV